MAKMWAFLWSGAQGTARSTCPKSSSANYLPKPTPPYGRPSAEGIQCKSVQSRTVAHDRLMTSSPFCVFRVFRSQISSRNNHHLTTAASAASLPFAAFAASRETFPSSPYLPPPTVTCSFLLGGRRIPGRPFVRQRRETIQGGGVQAKKNRSASVFFRRTWRPACNAALCPPSNAHALLFHHRLKAGGISKTPSPHAKTMFISFSNPH